jgi:hypothetical protein
MHSDLYIGLLTQLFRRPVPAELRRSKVERGEEGGEAAFDLRKGFIQRKQFAQMRLAFEPHVLSRIPVQECEQAGVGDAGGLTLVDQWEMESAARDAAVVQRRAIEGSVSDGLTQPSAPLGTAARGYCV